MWNVRVYIILCKLIDEFSKFNALPFYLHKNFYTLWNVGYENNKNKLYCFKKKGNERGGFIGNAF